jgi:hypothetical protein
MGCQEEVESTVNIAAIAALLSTIVLLVVFGN